jgi:hypothetical protein
MMKINQTLLSIAILGAILGLASCKDDDSGGNLSKDQAKTKLSEFNSTAVSDLQELSEADGLKAIKDFMNLVDTDDPFSRIGTDKKSIKQFFREKGKDFKTIFVPKSWNGRTIEEGGFDFENNKGVYTWNSAEDIFEKTGESDIISILFPTTDSKDGELKITAYQEKEFYDDESEEYYYNPEVLKASLSVNEIEVASIDLDIEWSNDAFPVTADLTVSVSPFTGNISFGGTATTSTLSTSLKKANKIIIAASVTVKYDSETKNAENLKSLEGYVQLKNIKVQGSVDVKAMDASQSGDPNDYVHLSLYGDNKKLGDITFRNKIVDGDEVYVAFIKYNDGAEDELSKVLKDVIEELKVLEEELDDNG